MSDCTEKIHWFCYICGKYTLKGKRRTISSSLEAAYRFYFALDILKDVQWVPSKCCLNCASNLLEFMKRKRAHMPFGMPMIWHIHLEHSAADCYVCINKKVFSYNRTNRAAFRYQATSLVSLPVPHSDALPVPRYPSPEAANDEESEDFLGFETMSVPGIGIIFSHEFNSFTINLLAGEYDPTFALSEESSRITLFNRSRLLAMVRKLQLSQRKAELLTSELKYMRLTTIDVTVHMFRNRQRVFMQYFTNNAENTYVFCHDVNGLMRQMGMEHNAADWRIFIDSSKSSLKAVLLHVENSLPSVPIAYGIKMKETYETMKLILDSVLYGQHQWRLCADLKVVALVSGLQLGWTNHACFLCDWHTRYAGNQYEKNDWPARGEQQIGEMNIQREALIPNERILIPPLHVKLGIMKNFVKSLPRESAGFQFLKDTFPHISSSKIKEGNILSRVKKIDKIEHDLYNEFIGVFVGPDIRKLMRSEAFSQSLPADHAIAWDLMKAVFQGFLGKTRVANYRVLINDLMDAFSTIHVHMSLKIHFLHHHIDAFERQVPTESDEQGERFHQTCKPLEERFKGKNLQSFIADLCWLSAKIDI